MWDMEREAALGGVGSLSLHSHIVQRLDGMMRPPSRKTVQLWTGGGNKSRTRDGLRIAATPLMLDERLNCSKPLTHWRGRCWIAIESVAGPTA
jgi:hypothetical protein